MQQQLRDVLRQEGSSSAWCGFILSGDQAAERAMTLLEKLHPTASAVEQAEAIMIYSRANDDEAHYRWDLGICPDCEGTVRDVPGFKRCECLPDGTTIACDIESLEVVWNR